MSLSEPVYTGPGESPMIVARSWKDADGVAAMRDFLRQPLPRRGACRELMTELLAEDPFTRRCAADLARRVSAREPGILAKYAEVLIDLVLEIPADEWQARGYATLTAALNTSTHAQRMRLASPVRALTHDDRIAVRAMALEAFGILAASEPELRDEAMLMIENARRDDACAMRSRARRMLLLMLSAESKSNL
jgi:hypothetical protein